MTNKRKRVNGKKLVSFKVQFVTCVIIAFILATTSFLITIFVGAKVVDEFFLSEEAEAQRDVELYQSFVSFVEENNVASTDTEKFDEWISRYEDKVYLTVYRENKVYLNDFEIVGSDIVDNNNQNKPDKVPNKDDDNEIGEGNIYSNYDRTIYSVRFEDGVCAVTIAHDYTSIYTIIVLLIAVTIFFIVFFVITGGFDNHLRRKITELSEQVSVVAEGGLNIPISLGGRDEITLLSEEAEKMRSTLVDKIESENKAWKANNELITSISHDIRTPLTALVGYSDILHNEQYSSETEKDSYIERCRDKIYRLKDLTDELFKYSLVFGTPEISVEFTEENAAILLSQLLGEPLAELKAKGVSVATTILINDITISVDVQSLKRVFDNLFSNINKYADFEKPIVATVTKNGSVINVKLINFKKELENPVESSKIGLKTCQRICQSLNIEFSYLERKDRFTAELFIPILDK